MIITIGFTSVQMMEAIIIQKSLNELTKLSS